MLDTRLRHAALPSPKEEKKSAPTRRRPQSAHPIYPSPAYSIGQRVSAQTIVRCEPILCACATHLPRDSPPPRSGDQQRSSYWSITVSIYRAHLHHTLLKPLDTGSNLPGHLFRIARLQRAAYGAYPRPRPSSARVSERVSERA